MYLGGGLSSCCVVSPQTSCFNLHTPFYKIRVYNWITLDVRGGLIRRPTNCGVKFFNGCFMMGDLYGTGDMGVQFCIQQNIVISFDFLIFYQDSDSIISFQ